MREKGPRDFIHKEAQNTEKSLVFGRVSKVWDKQSDELEEGNIEVNVLTKSGKNEIRRVPLTCFDHSGHVVVPQEGDPIVVDYVSGRGKTAVGVASSHDDRDAHRAPNALAGHWRHEWPGNNDNVYLEAEPGDGSDGTPELVRMGIKPSGLEEATTEVAVDNSGASPQIRIETDGDIELNADGDILINTDAGAEPVAKQNHTHDYEDTGDTEGGGGGSSTKTSTPPNEEPTETQIG